MNEEEFLENLMNTLYRDDNNIGVKYRWMKNPENPNQGYILVDEEVFIITVQRGMIEPV